LEALCFLKLKMYDGQRLRLLVSDLAGCNYFFYFAPEINKDLVTVAIFLKVGNL